MVYFGFNGVLNLLLHSCPHQTRKRSEGIKNTLQHHSLEHLKGNMKNNLIVILQRYVFLVGLSKRFNKKNVERGLMYICSSSNVLTSVKELQLYIYYS